ncbi:MAG TPA: DinB family protein [Nitriliruptoraceae bacterium]|nr:DinB family protein [Nitriliruptoraceae bacterium]
MELKERMQEYLDRERESLFTKVDGLSERDLRLPRTPTGTNLLGIVKHCANVEFGYFGPTFGRMIDDPAGLLGPDDFDTDPQADWYATATETADDIVALYRRVIVFANHTIAELDLDATGRVPWWGPDAPEVTLGHILTHVHADVARHAGQADILREGIDGAAGWWSPGDNLPDDFDFPAYVDRLTALADQVATTRQR